MCVERSKGKTLPENEVNCAPNSCCQVSYVSVFLSSSISSLKNGDSQDGCCHDSHSGNSSEPPRCHKSNIQLNPSGVVVNKAQPPRSDKVGRKYCSQTIFLIFAASSTIKQSMPMYYDERSPVQPSPTNDSGRSADLTEISLLRPAIFI